MIKMDNQLAISDHELSDLKEKIREQQRLAEYQKLKQELFDITFKANNTPNEFDGGMKIADTEQVLKNKNAKNTLSSIIIDRVIRMCAIRPITGNLIAIAISVVAIITMNHYLLEKDLKTMVTLLTYLAEAAIGVQILKSASRSLVLPMAALIFSITALSHIEKNQILFHHPVLFFQIALMVSIVGLTISSFSID